MTTDDVLTLDNLLALICADIDIFLLKEEDQVTNKPGPFTAEQIVTQLKITAHKTRTMLNRVGIQTNVPIQSTSLATLDYSLIPNELPVKKKLNGLS